MFSVASSGGKLHDEPYEGKWAQKSPRRKGGKLRGLDSTARVEETAVESARGKLAYIARKKILRVTVLLVAWSVMLSPRNAKIGCNVTEVLLANVLNTDTM